MTLRPVYICNFCCDFQCDFLLLTDVKERINNECSEYMFPQLNIRVWFTRSHLSKENRTRNRSKSCKCKRAFSKPRVDIASPTVNATCTDLCLKPGLSKQAGGRRSSGGWDEVYDRLLSLKYTGQTSLYPNDYRIVHCNQ